MSVRLALACRPNPIDGADRFNRRHRCARRRLPPPGADGRDRADRPGRQGHGHAFTASNHTWPVPACAAELWVGGYVQHYYRLSRDAMLAEGTGLVIITTR